MNIIYLIQNIKVLKFLITFTLYREEQFKAPKRKFSSRLRIESHPTDVHKGINIKSLLFYCKIDRIFHYLYSFRYISSSVFTGVV